jgi:hypothetical protein
MAAVIADSRLPDWFELHIAYQFSPGIPQQLKAWLTHLLDVRINRDIYAYAYARGVSTIGDNPTIDDLTVLRSYPDGPLDLALIPNWEYSMTHGFELNFNPAIIVLAQAVLVPVFYDNGSSDTEDEF